LKDTRLFEQILEISLPWYVKEVNLNKESKELSVEISYRETIWACPECRCAMHIHEYNDRRWRHLDSCQFKTIITAKIPRVQCPTHGTQVVKAPWAEERSRFTLLFERFAIDVLLECSVSGACDLLGISWDEASGIKQRAVKRGMSRKEAKVCAHIGVDEKRAGRGQNGCATKK
jgi:transposase